MTLLLRGAEPADLMAVGRLHHRSRLAAYRGFVPAAALTDVSEELLGQWWSERWRWERDTLVLTVAERAGRLAGFSYLGPDEEGSAGTGQLYALYVDPVEQGRGVGRELMLDALAALRRQGWRRAVLWVLAGNTRARRFYARAGWTLDGADRLDMVGPARTRQLRYAHALPGAPVSVTRGGPAGPAG